MSPSETEKIGSVSATMEHREATNDIVGVQAEKVLSAASAEPKYNSLAYHEEVAKTAQESKAEKRFVRKVDLMIMPLLACIYFLASLDRGDIGFAASAGMTTDLKMSPQQLSTAVSLFYVGYIVFQLPGALLLRVLTPPIQLGLALVVWGAFTASLAGADSYTAVAGLRVGVGFGESFIQASPLYLTLWYKRNEIATRGALFFSTSAIAGAFNGIIAYGILTNLNGKLGIPAWKWIFLIEGVISIAYGFVIYFLLPPVPERVKFGFSQEEKEIAVRRTKEAYNILDAKIDVRQLLALFKDPKAYFILAIYCCVNVNFASFSTFLPVMIKSFGYSTLDAQLFTIPVYVSGAISTVVLGMTSDYFKRRGAFLIGCFTCAAVGWIMLLASPSSGVSFAGTFFIAVGTYPTIVLTQSWMNSNIIGFTRRAGMLAGINMIGQCFSIIAAQVYSDAPKYYRGNGFALGAVVIGIMLSSALWVYLVWKNNQKAKNRNSEEAIRNRVIDIDHIGDAHPDFIYYL